MRTVAIVALKGGSGKTTIGAHLALAAHLRGAAVTVVDIDPQQSSHNVLSARGDDGPVCIAASAAGLMAAQFAAQGLKRDLLVIDTPAGAVEDVTEAIVLADYVVLVARPTLLDLAGLARTMPIVRRLKKRSVVVVNQAPVARSAVEPPVIKRALRGLAFMQAHVAPTIIRLRAAYQIALETGRSAEESTDAAAARDMASLWEFIAAELSGAPSAWMADDDAPAERPAPPPPGT